jgi:hypothetical protein
VRHQHAAALVSGAVLMFVSVAAWWIARAEPSPKGPSTVPALILPPGVTARRSREPSTRFGKLARALSSVPSLPALTGQSPLATGLVLSASGYVLFFALLATVVARPAWCPATLCPVPIAVCPGGVRDADLCVTLQTLESPAYVLQGSPAQYSLGRLPPTNVPPNVGIAAARIDHQAAAAPFRVVLDVHSLESGQYGLTIRAVGLVVRQVVATPRPLNVWVEDPGLTYDHNLYRATYGGQLSGLTLPATFVTLPRGQVHLRPGETDTLVVELDARVPADLLFGVQVTYSGDADASPHTLTLPSVLGVVFADATNWHTYRLVDGRMTPMP